MTAPAQESRFKELVEDVYKVGVAFVGGVSGLGVFLGGWWYAVSTFGWFLGLSLGWIPAAILGVMAGFVLGYMWPLLVFFGFLFWLDRQP